MSRIFVLIALIALAVIPGFPAVAQESCDALPARITVGATARVTPGDPNRLRAEPGTAAEQVGQIPAEAEFTITGDSVCAGGYRWWPVEYDGRSGWTAEGNAGGYFVDPVLPGIDTAEVWGYGMPTDTLWLGDLAVATGVGVWLYDASDLATPPHHLGDDWRIVHSLALNPADPDQLAAAGPGGVQLWNVSAGTIQRVIEQPASGLLDLAYSADGLRLMARTSGEAYVWDVATGQLINTFTLPDVDRLKAALSPDGARIAIGDIDTPPRLYNVDSGDLIRDNFPFDADLGMADAVALAFSPDGQQLAAGDFEGNFRVWNLADDAYLEYARPYIGDPNTPSVLEFVFLPDGHLLTGEDRAAGGLRLWTLDGAIELVAEIDPPNFSDALGLSVSPDGARIAAVVTADTVITTVEVVDLASFTTAASLDDFAPSRAVTLSEDGTRLVTEGIQSLRVYDTATGQVAATLTHDAYWVNGIAVNSDNTLVAACLDDNIFSFEPGLYLWSTRESHAAFEVYFDFNALCLHPFFYEDRLHFLSSAGVYADPGDGFQPVIEADTMNARTAVSGGSRVAFTNGQASIDVLNLDAPGASSLVIPWAEDDVYAQFGTAPLAISADGMLLARRSGPSVGLIDLFDLTHGEPALVQTLGGSETVTGLTFSPDGRWLAAGLWNGTTTLYDLRSGLPVAELRGGANIVRSLAFSPDSATLYTAATDNGIRVWDLSDLR